MHRDKLKTLLAGSQALNAPGIYDGLSALLVEQAEFDLCFFSGASFSFARYGRPDMGLISMQEVADAVAIIRERIQIPMIVDIDTGFGNALNVQRTVKVFERSGATALQMEDQVMPKRCGQMTGKSVIDKDEMIGKIKAALDAREYESTALVVRTDALAVNGFDDAMQRAEQYLETGADMLFIEAPQTIEQMRLIGERFGDRVPLIHNLVEGGNSPVTSVKQLQTLNYRIALYPAALLHQFIPNSQTLLNHIKQYGETDNYPETLISLRETNSILGAQALLNSVKKY